MKHQIKAVWIIATILILILLSCTEKPKSVKGEEPIAALFIVHAFEAQTTEEAVEYPILPGETAIWTWDEVVQNAEEVKDRLKSIYNYQTYKLRRVLCYSWFSDKDGWQSEYKSNWIEIQPAGGLLDGRLSYIVKIHGDMLEKQHTVRVAGQSGETTVIGTPLEENGTERKALFITVTPLFQSIRSQSDYQHFIEIYEEATAMAPGQPRASHRFLINWLNDLAIESLKIKDPANPDSLSPDIKLETGDDGDIDFVEYDAPPMPVGGFGAISKNLIYPEPARKAGLEGRVLVYVRIDTSGRMTTARVVNSPDESLDQAALAALEKTAWQPAKKETRPVSVWIAIPVDFRLQ
ncbi:energy transducer TonB [candidate division KSB1 bacterium]|nr:energy transducer TonB [candidate division KSB1 bacterium]